MLPGIDGLEVTKILKNDSRTKDIPIVMLTAKGEEADIVTGLELGADDYITKPFSPRVLVARVRAVLRRKVKEYKEETPVLRIHDISIHPGRHEVLVNDKPVQLTLTEFGILNYLAKSPDDTERFLGIIEKHVGRLEAIIEELLRLSRIEQEAEKEKTVLSEGRIEEVLKSAIQVCDLKAVARKTIIKLSCAEDIGTKINPALLEQAVVNLLDNAIKYSDAEGMVGVKATQEDNEIIISVSDQGQGIEKKHLPRLFERFYRVDRARSRQLGGTGLGLAIVKHIVQAHGGHVLVESAPKEGSTFEIHLPIMRVSG